MCPEHVYMHRGGVGFDVVRKRLKSPCPASRRSQARASSLPSEDPRDCWQRERSIDQTGTPVHRKQNKARVQEFPVQHNVHRLFNLPEWWSRVTYFPVSSTQHQKSVRNLSTGGIYSPIVRLSVPTQRDNVHASRESSNLRLRES